MLKMVLFSLSFCFITIGMADAQSCAITVSGQVQSVHPHEPLEFVSIRVLETQTGTTTNQFGDFELPKLCKGEYTLEFSFLGWTTDTMSIDVRQDTVLYVFMDNASLDLEAIVITEAVVPLTLTQNEVGLAGQALEARQGFNFGESLKALPGVSVLNTGATISKPVIQGLHSARILVLNNGIRQEGQQWGLEHAPEIDPFVADKITVVKGANSVRYGADAIGGVILVEPKPLRKTAGLAGVFNLGGSTNGRVGVTSLMLEGSLGKNIPLSGRIQGTLKKGGNLSTPDYYLGNTGIEEYNYSWALGYDKGPLESEVFYSAFITNLGIFRGAHIGNLTDLQNAIERGAPLDDPGFSYDLNRPLQRIYHEMFKWNTNYNLGEKTALNVVFSRQFNRRQEFDAHRRFGELPEEATDPDIEFELTTYTGEVALKHKPIANWQGEMGVSVMQQANTTDRGGLIPNYESWNAGIYWIERWKKYPSPFEIEVGLRYDYRWQDVGVQGQDTIGTTMTFQNISGSIGGIYKFRQHWTAKLDFGTAWRPPHVSELYSDGVHHGSASYEEGNPDLKIEKAYNTSLTLEFDDHSTWLANVSVYYNRIQDFIYLQPQEQPRLTIRGAFPAFEYLQTNARIMGLDGSLKLQFAKNWTVGTVVSLVRGRDLTNRVGLIFMPEDRLQFSLEYTFDQLADVDRAPFIRVSVLHALRQTRVPANVDYAPTPPAYTLLNLDAGVSFKIGKQRIDASLVAENILNTSYRSYLNRFRYFADELGRNVSIRFKIPLFNIN
jgi:iron complex outermembrane receptor protein